MKIKGSDETLEGELPEKVRLFPLPDHVLLPDLPSPYRVFEPRYLQLISDLKELPESERWIAMPRLAPGWKEDYEGAPAFLRIATIGRVTELTVDEDGFDHIVVKGVERVRLYELPSDRLYRVARVALCPDYSEVDHDELRLHSNTIAQLVASLSPYLDENAQSLSGALEDAKDLDMMVYRLASIFLPNPDLRQRFLETRRLDLRLALLEDVMAATLALAHEAVKDDPLPS